ncbi:MAG: LacI family DNA-binding transcriptional regulator [Verrucomicrobiota bacterium]
MKERPPLQVIAELLGVSKMTVSRGLRDGTPVAPEMRRRVREAARRLGYRPDTRLSQVMSAIRRSQAPHCGETLAFIWAHAPPAAGAPLAEAREGARRRAHQLGYQLEEFDLAQPARQSPALSRVLRQRGIRAALLVPGAAANGTYGLRLDWRRLCAVVLGDAPAPAGLPRIGHDHYFGCVLALRRLRRLRRGRVALVLPRSGDGRTARLVRAAFLHFHPLGAEKARGLVFTADRPARLEPRLRRARAEAVLVPDAIPFPDAEHPWHPAPAGLAVAALDWSAAEPGIAGVRQHRAIIGEQAVDLLVLRLQGNQFGLDPLAPSIRVPGSWVGAPATAPGTNGAARAMLR